MRRLVFIPDVFVFSDIDGFLVYNASNHKKVDFPHSAFLDGMFRALESVNSLYRYPIQDKDVEENSAILSLLEVDGFAKLYTNEEDIPFSFAPIPKLDVDLNKIRAWHQDGVGGHILSFLRTIDIFFSEKGLLADVDLQHFIEKLIYCPLSRVNIHLPSSHLENKYGNSFALIEEMIQNVHYYLACPEWKMKSIESFINRHVAATVKVCGNYSEVQSYVKHYPSVIYADNMEDWNCAIEVSGAEVYPLYTGTNMVFLRQVLFTREEDIYQATKRDIFVRQTLNSNYFGRLVINPDGVVSSGIYGTAVGTIADTPYNLIYRELMSETSLWMLRRDNTECKKCRFKYLCPCVSDYELSIGKTQLCWKGD